MWHIARYNWLPNARERKFSTKDNMHEREKERERDRDRENKPANAKAGTEEDTGNSDDIHQVLLRESARFQIQQNVVGYVQKIGHNRQGLGVVSLASSDSLVLLRKKKRQQQHITNNTYLDFLHISLPEDGWATQFNERLLAEKKTSQRNCHRRRTGSSLRTK